jgi:hypothetical protein
VVCFKLQGGLNMTGTNCDLFTHNQSRSYLNRLVLSHTFYGKTEANSGKLQLEYAMDERSHLAAYNCTGHLDIELQG